MNEIIEKFLEQTGYEKRIVDRFLELHTPEELYCKCGSPKMLRTVNNRHMKNPEQRLGFYCGKKECHPRYGIARPEHSAHMKKLAQHPGSTRFKQSLIQRGEKRNLQVNTVEFKRTKLQNLGFNVTNLTDREVEKMNSQWESDKFKRPEQIASRIEKFVKKHNLQDRFPVHTADQLLSLEKDDFSQIAYRWRSWHHAVYCADKCGAKHFRRIPKSSLRFNIRGRDLVITRSSYEANYIDFFELNQIPWDYEPLKIDLGDTTYTPDFLFEFKDQTYLLEVKGYLLEKNRIQYLETKINGGFDYAQSRDWEFIFTYKSHPETISQLLSHTMKEKF